MLLIICRRSILLSALTCCIWNQNSHSSNGFIQHCCNYLAINRTGRSTEQHFTNGAAFQASTPFASSSFRFHPLTFCFSPTLFLYMYSTVIEKKESIVCMERFHKLGVLQMVQMKTVNNHLNVHLTAHLIKGAKGNDMFSYDLCVVCLYHQSMWENKTAAPKQWHLPFKEKRWEVIRLGKEICSFHPSGRNWRQKG